VPAVSRAPTGGFRFGGTRPFRPGALIDFLVEFAEEDDDFARFIDFKQALESLLARRVDLVDRKAIESSRNYIRKRHILTGVESVYAA
jgi:hypothetical protein